MPPSTPWTRIFCRSPVRLNLSVTSRQVWTWLTSPSLPHAHLCQHRCHHCLGECRCWKHALWRWSPSKLQALGTGPDFDRGDAASACPCDFPVEVEPEGVLPAAPAPAFDDDVGHHAHNVPTSADITCSLLSILDPGMVKVNGVTCKEMPPDTPVEVVSVPSFQDVLPEVQRTVPGLTQTEYVGVAESIHRHRHRLATARVQSPCE